MENFVFPLIGGLLIGISTSVMLYFNGKITGISGIVGQLLGKFGQIHDWKYFFIFGLIVGGLVMKILFPRFFDYSIDLSFYEISLAGFLVGFGTLMGNGCTSGHGVCGLARLSHRSLVATLTFIATGVLTVFLKGVL